MFVRDLIAKLEGIAAPDAEVFFFDGHYVTAIHGGLLDYDYGDGPRQGLLLTHRECAGEEGGF